MIWKTIDNKPNDHWLVSPHHPKYIKVGEGEEFDSYALFRSRWLDLDVNLTFKTSLQKEMELYPKVNVYSHTFRWLNSWVTVMGTVSRPVFKGRIWGNLKPPKKKLTRHYRKVTFNTSFECVELECWTSYRKRAGAKLLIASGNIEITHKLTLEPWAPITLHGEDGCPFEVFLTRRPRTNWTTKKCRAELHDIQGSLKGSREHIDDEDEAPKLSPEHFLFSISSVEYQQRDDKSGSSDSLHSNHSRDSKNYTHWVNITDVKASLNIDTRTLLLEFLEQYESSRALRCDLSAEALKVIILDPSSYKSPRSSTYEAPKDQSNVDLLSRFDDDNVTIVTVDDRTRKSREKLAGEQACSDSDIKSRKWYIQMVNGQVALQGPQLQGFLILTTGKCQVLGSEHRPVLRGGESFSKFSWVCIVEHVQYFATVDVAPDCEIPWLDENVINVRCKRNNSSCGPELSSESIFMDEPSEETLKSIVRDVYRHDTKESVTQLQRIVRRCGCMISFATFGSQPLEDDSPVDPHDQISTELLSAFSLRHKNLEVATNSHQYKMIIDCVNYLILRTEGSKRSSKARLQHAIRLMESGQTKAREHILRLQDQIRDLLHHIKDSERRLYELRYHDPVIKKPFQDKLKAQKRQLASYRVKLRLTISAFKDYITNTGMMESGFGDDHVEVRKSDICIDEANWTLTGQCGQIPVMEVVIRENFLYSRTVFNTSSEINHDFSSGHKITLGYFSIKNLQRKREYVDVLFPRNDQNNFCEDDYLNRNARLSLRVFLSQKHQQVGGININDHLEINMAPLVLNYETYFWREIQKFFLGHVRPEQEENFYDELDDSSSIHPLNFEQRSVKLSKKKSFTSSKRSIRKLDGGDPNKTLDDMTEMNSKIFFNLVKIQEIPILINYKGERLSAKDKNVVFPKIELTQRLCTWKELSLEIKKISVPKIVLSLGKSSKHRSTLPIIPLLNINNNNSVNDEIREQANYRLLTGLVDDEQVKKKKGSKKKHKFIKSKKTPSHVPNESYAEECPNPGEWEEGSLSEKIFSLAESLTEGGKQSDTENIENSSSVKNQFG